MAQRATNNGETRVGVGLLVGLPRASLFAPCVAAKNSAKICPHALQQVGKASFGAQRRFSFKGLVVSAVIAPSVAVNTMLSRAVQFPSTSAPNTVDFWMLSGFLVALLGLVFLKQRNHYPFCRLALALCCAYMALFAAISGAWPAGILLLGWAAVSFKDSSQQPLQRPARKYAVSQIALAKSRTRQLFGGTIQSDNKNQNN